ncbi:MAG: transcriptional regulator NrdR [Fibrobacterota bacterium]
MKCPYCRNMHDKVIDSRSSQNGAAIRRRRECTECSRRFTTYEYIEDFQMAIIKKDLRRENYSRQKLLEGIKIACKKRPVSMAAINALADTVEKSIRQSGEDEIASFEIGKKVMKELAQIDQIAYIRFATVYLDVNSAEEFIKQTGIWDIQ